jgi:hypothetical protein
MRCGYNVYSNDRFVAFIDGRSWKACKDFVRYDHRCRIGTHMGQWRRVLTIKPENIKATCYEREYHTTVGICLRFSPSMENA